MSWQAPNLARAPFLNLGPLRRVAALLWLVAIAWTAWNATAAVRAGSGAAARAAELERLEGESATARARLATLESDLAARDLAAEDRRVSFLNQRIDQRTFSWNRLFDRLAAVLPPTVRLRQVTPRQLEAAPSEPPDGAAPRPVQLDLSAAAADDEAMLELVDRLFAADAFADPNLARERRQDDGEVSFELSVVYRPEGGR